MTCAQFLTKQGVPVAITDSRKQPPGLEELVQALPQVPLSLGKLDAELLQQATEIVISPGVAATEPVIAQCVELGIPVIGDIELFARHVTAPVVAITGSNGKGTVTTLVGNMAKHAGIKVSVGGNIGMPALSLLLQEPAELYVLELSSFQLETTTSLKPVAAVVLNVSEDHMDRYESLEQYRAVKQTVYRHCDNAIFNRDDPLSVNDFKAGKYPAKKQTFSFGLEPPKNDEFGVCWQAEKSYLAFGSQLLLATQEMQVPGRHNWSNALAAMALAKAIGLPEQAMQQALREFTGLPHRCQAIANAQGVGWFNDSKGTNVGATVAALEGLGVDISGKLVLIAGGMGKGADFSLLRAPLQTYVRELILLGEDAKKIASQLDSVVPISYVSGISEAVSLAHSKAQPGDAVLLSPACASFDMFSGFAHRGDVYTSTVKELLA